MDTTRAEKRPREDMVEKVAISKPRGASDEARPADSLISDSWPPGRERNVGRLSHPGCGILLWQLSKNQQKNPTKTQNTALWKAAHVTCASLYNLPEPTRRHGNCVPPETMPSYRARGEEREASRARTRREPAVSLIKTSGPSRPAETPESRGVTPS